MAEKKYQIGMVGLGVMGRNFVLNMADHGYRVAGYDKDLSKVKALRTEADSDDVFGAENMQEFIQSLKSPRAIMMLVPAGPVVDSVIKDLIPHLEKDDLIIDGGNSHFKDTDLRQSTMAEKGFHYLGVGISGGERGARHGPSMMPGGPEVAYRRVREIFEAASAKVNGEPCVVYLGPGSAGHYVKMVHNGIEYGLMQLIAETYDLMKRGLNMSDDEMHQVYQSWNQGELNSYLLDITANIFTEVDEQTGGYLINVILDEAKQKGTGKWTSEDAMDLQIPVPTIDMAVAMRNLSIYKDQRIEASQSFQREAPSFKGDRDAFLKALKNAFYASMIITFAQGMAQLRIASDQYDYGLDLEAVARIWRGGCIIRAALLEDIRRAYKRQPDLANLLLDPDLGKLVRERLEDLKLVVSRAVNLEIPVPSLMVSLSYFEAYHSSWLPANLIQAQRDYFGAHTYERKDEKGVFHTKWENEAGQ